MAGEVIMGHRSYGTPIVRGDISDIYIGKYCSIAQNVIVDLGFHHETNFVTTYPLNVFFAKLSHIKGHPKSKGDIRIGNDVWIGEGTIIMGGITIGDGAVVGAGSVVTKNVKPYEIVGGAPAKFIKSRLSWYDIPKMQSIAWWDWSDDKVVENGELLMSENITQFITKFYEKTKVQ